MKPTKKNITLEVFKSMMRTSKKDYVILSKSKLKDRSIKKLIKDNSINFKIENGTVTFSLNKEIV